MDKHRLRRAILAAVKASEPGAATLADIAAYPPIGMAGIERDRLVDELRGLADHWYLVDLAPTRAPVVRLSAKGRDQINQETRLEEYIWGELAL